MKRKLLISSLIFCTLSVLSGGGQAAAVVGCDPQYMDAMEARGKIEFNREHAQNQNFILKADSVLEYSCFLNDANGVSGNFTNSGSISNTVIFPTFTYVFSNFGHTFLGGHAPLVAAAGTPGGCVTMAYVWQLAHCINFYDNAATDGWFDFSWYTSNDPRTLPRACTTNSVQNGDINIAFNGKQGSYVPAAENPNDATQYLVDDINAHTDVFGTDCASSPMIPTGVIVHRKDFTPEDYKEKICPYPGCYYLPTDMENGECKNSP